MPLGISIIFQAKDGFAVSFLLIPLQPMVQLASKYERNLDRRSIRDKINMFNKR